MASAGSLLDLGLLAILVVPIVAWMIVHRRPADSGRADDRPSGGPRHRWWQP
jgi:hypothetical protein